MKGQHVILCEGFDDRAFWAGWLLHLGCEDPSEGGKRRVKDAWRQTVVAGKYLFTTPGGSMVLVHPFGGRSEARETVWSYLHQRNTKPVNRMIVNLDSDAEGKEPTPSAHAVVEGIVRDFETGVVGGAGSPHTVGDIRIWPVVWECRDVGEIPGVPRQQTLERLAASAIVAVSEQRGLSVQRWLDDEPVEKKKSHKNYGMSYFAKWYAQEHGHGDFYRALWRDKAIAEQLESRLRESGAWKPVEELVAD